MLMCYFFNDPSYLINLLLVRCNSSKTTENLEGKEDENKKKHVAVAKANNSNCYTKQEKNNSCYSHRVTWQYICANFITGQQLIPEIITFLESSTLWIG